MSKTYETAQNAEKAFLVGIRDKNIGRLEGESLLLELGSLASTLGIETVGTSLVSLKDKNPATLLGSGKVEELVNLAKDVNADSIIIDGPLSPIQQRNWEKISGLSVYDRSELIIDIFASRARTREASLQVELARLRYFLPRLAHSYSGLHRQKGGSYGTKGSGEQKIELDRREISRKISDIEEELEGVRRSRSVQRKKRERLAIKRAALVGYTNAGKSSLLNAIAPKAEVLTEDKLFATLDPTTRRLDTSGGSILVSDTVGFIRRLPHGLIEAFKASLEEVVDADLLIHVVDLSDPEADIQEKASLEVLAGLGADSSKSLLVYNKIDKLANNINTVQRPGAIFVSAKSGKGIPELIAAIEAALSEDEKELLLEIPARDYAVAALLYREARIISEEHIGELTIIRCKLPDRLLSKVEPYIKQP